MSGVLLGALFLGPAILSGQTAGVEIHLEAAKKAEAGGDFATAEREYEASLKLRTDAEILQRLGLVRHLQNKFAAAIPAFEKALQLKPDLWGSQLFLGIDYYRTNQFAKALPHLQKANQLEPGNPEVRFWLGATQLALKQYLTGLATLEELSSRQPDNLETLRILAQGYSDYAVALLNQVAEKHPESALAYQVHGQALENEGAWDAALQEYRTALSLDPRREGVHEAIGRILWSQGKQQEAVAEFERELAIQPQEPESHYYLGRHWIARSEPSKARGHLRIASQWTPYPADAIVLLSQVYLALGELGNAEESAARAVELAPRSEEAHRALLAAYEKLEKPEMLSRENQRWKARQSPLPR